MDKCQLSILPIGDPDMRHVQPLDRSNKTEDIAILDSGRTFLDLLFRHIIMRTQVYLLFLIGHPSNPFRMVLQLLIAIRMRGYKR